MHASLLPTARGAKQGANSTVPKLKTVSFCLDNLMWVPAIDIGGMGLKINTFTGDVFGCQQVVRATLS